MRPVNQPPLSLIATKRSPLASSRKPDRPPKPRNFEVRISPLRYCRSPKRTCERSRVLKEPSGRASTSIDTGAVTEYSSGLYFGGGCTALCARSGATSAAVKIPAAVDARKPRRLTGWRMCSGMQASAAAGWCTLRLAEQFGELLGNRAAEFLGIDDGNGTSIVARDVVADADRDQFDRRAGFDLLDDLAQMPFEIIAGVDRKRGIVNRRAVGNHHQDAPLLGTSEQALVRPIQRLAVDVLLQQAFAHHQAEIFP